MQTRETEQRHAKTKKQKNETADHIDNCKMCCCSLRRSSWSHEYFTVGLYATVALPGPNQPSKCNKKVGLEFLLGMLSVAFGRCSGCLRRLSLRCLSEALGAPLGPCRTPPGSHKEPPYRRHFLFARLLALSVAILGDFWDLPGAVRGPQEATSHLKSTVSDKSAIVLGSGVLC